LRRRAKRDLTVIVGIVVALGLVAFANYNFQRGDLAKRMNALRMEEELAQRQMGIPVMEWRHLTETRGSSRSGPTFLDELVERDGEHIYIVGFMVPLQQFRNMSEFILLPLPIECYFCRIPPISHVVLVQMAEDETANLYREPVLINGTLQLNEGAGTKFFYQINDARMGASSGKLTPYRPREEHMAPSHTEEPELTPGFIPPTTPQLD